MNDFNVHKRSLSAILKQNIGIINFEGLFTNFCRHHSELVSKFNVGSRNFLHEGLSDPMVTKYTNYIGLSLLIILEKSYDT